MRGRRFAELVSWWWLSKIFAGLSHNYDIQGSLGHCTDAEPLKREFECGRRSVCEECQDV